MDITNNIKNGMAFVGETVSEIAASIAEKNRLRVQLNHIKGLIKADSATRDQAYIELGRYFYDYMRDGTTAENEAICAVIDAANDRISKASLKYVELLNMQNDTKIRSENAEKLAKAAWQPERLKKRDLKPLIRLRLPPQITPRKRKRPLRTSLKRQRSLRPISRIRLSTKLMS